MMNLSAAIERALEERSAELCLTAGEQQSAVVEGPPVPDKRTTLAEQEKNNDEIAGSNA
jgi:hypothetical protein